MKVGGARAPIAFLAVLAALLVSCAGTPAATPSTSTATATSLPFPRTATYWLEQNEIPSVEELARYDLVVIDSEWGHRLQRADFERLRALNPDIVLLAYVNLIDYRPELGSAGYYADRYALWQFRDSTTSTFPQQWLARTARGARVSEWPETVMANLADTAPRIDGRTYAEYAARWVVDQVWLTGLWDGVFLDVWGDRIYGASHSRWDVDGDGSDDPEDRIYGPGGPWERGITSAERIMRQAMPDALLIGNGERTLREGLLDGRVFESFADLGGGRNPASDIDGYLGAASSDGHRKPGLALNINVRRAQAGSPEEYRNARFFLTATLLQDGFWAPMGQHYGELAYYDELDGGGLGPGYLGAPLVANPAPEQLDAPFADGLGVVAQDVVRRDFEHGIVLNNAGTTARAVDLGGTFRHLAGRQDPATNDGSVVTTVTVPPGDGLILLR
ncbi:putative glycoside hydrolase [Pseudonocardia cypriaca]|uniref:Putative glycosyl hydrolase-like family 15 (GHL15) protein n=1 Tax=Pseudonocardia cypriaca TaxID=882449 RepID=A0A543GAR5_9PSEU|nr:putative glycoside hydrolase [Pseudonocardia cypriaca]TQM43094.1 putative glycosyl hydrolase-like family 15 (GHL15) protein [Pseudonocardia cypriaca]